ncbi:hypothetical protein EfmAA55_11840 [Enterococcus faecium]|nr:hypothetical protein EfmAA55_11840 [Enterococcus faecium]
MTSLKTLLFGTTLAAGAAFFMGTTAHADEAYTVQSIHCQGSNKRKNASYYQTKHCFI